MTLHPASLLVRHLATAGAPSPPGDPEASAQAEGTLVVAGPGGGWTAGSGVPRAVVSVHDRRAFGAVLRGSVGFAESYVEGWWDSDDLTDLVRILARRLSKVAGRADGLASSWGGPVSAVRRLRPPTIASDRRNVRAHYDLPGELFTAMLDETMTYSCAIFDTPETALAVAQRAKHDRICRKLDLGPDDHLLEIGTGWGGFAIHAASTYGCRVTTTTISEAQRVMATSRVAAEGLADHITVLGQDYRTLEGRFDKIVSVEMIEAVDWRRHDAFFASCGRLLSPRGLMLLQAIVIADQSYERAKHHDDFIRRMVFPGGCIPSITALCTSLTRASDLRLLNLEDIGEHYAPTLRHWDRNLDRRWGEVAAAGFDDRFHRLWHLYLCYCEGAFLERHISDVQMLLAAPNWRPGPGAAWL